MDNECSCTVVWLVKNYKYYFTNDFTNFNPNVNLQPAFKDYFVNVTINKCVRSEEYLSERINSCNFSRLFENCNLTKKFKTGYLNGIQKIIQLFNKFKV